MRFLFRIVPSGSTESTTRVIRGIASSIGGRAVNAKRTSYGAVEMDVFVSSKQDLDLFLAAIEPLGRLEFYKDLQEPPRFLPAREAVAEAVSLFNAERYWEAHEVLESLWRVAEGQEKSLLQGLILVCAALVHQQKGEMEVALGVARRALPLLSWKDGAYYGIEVESLGRKVSGEIEAGVVSVFKI